MHNSTACALQSQRQLLHLHIHPCHKCPLRPRSWRYFSKSCMVTRWEFCWNKLNTVRSLFQAPICAINALCPIASRVQRARSRPTAADWRTGWMCTRAGSGRLSTPSARTSAPSVTAGAPRTLPWAWLRSVKVKTGCMFGRHGNGV